MVPIFTQVRVSIARIIDATASDTSQVDPVEKDKK